jgi:glycosyltransferase involved in cell wall biosynthesis
MTVRRQPGKGHRIDIMDGVDGSLRSTYEAAGVGLRGPVLVRVRSAWRKLGERSRGAILLLVDSMSDDSNATLPAALERELLLLDPHSYRRFPITADVLRFLHACDMAVFPSLLQEAFGRVVIEGMATGRPVVASRVGAVPEILSGPMTRFLVEPSSPGQLADRLPSLLSWR